MLSSGLLRGFVLFSLLLHSSSAWQTDKPALHFTIQRRGDRIATHDAANLTRLASTLSKVELRYAKTERVVEGNRLGRQQKSRNTGTTIDDGLITAPGHDGIWQASVAHGDRLWS